MVEQQFGRNEPQLGPEALFGNKERMQGLNRRVLQEAQARYPQFDINPSSQYCMQVNPILEEALKLEDMPVDHLTHEQGGCISHVFSDVRGEKNWVVDFQYKQFVPQERRDESPDYMVFSFRTKDDVVKALTAHGVPEAKHHKWTEELEWEFRI